MDKSYTPKNIETSWYQTWEEKNYFKASGKGKNYCILIPPPNVTGSLHMGHAFQHTIMDALIRYHRMQGDNTLWQCGTDHAGIATQMVVERLLDQQGEKRSDYTREAFIEKVWQWKKTSGNTITQQMRRLGDSPDWQRETFTMDEKMSHAVQQVFIQLYQQGIIYRGKRLVNWDPKLQTAISDLEVENHDEKGFLWHFRYPLADQAKTSQGKDYLVVATTRPETMLGDAAVAVNPKDERYKNLIGKFVTLPLVQRKIPIIADDYVDMEFATGCVKITPAHDFNDYQVGQRHQLPLINIFSRKAEILSDAEAYDYQGKKQAGFDTHLPKDFAKLDRFTAREKIINAFKQLDLLEKIDDHSLKVPRGDRSNVVIEPLLTDQWYVAVESLAKPAIAAVKNGEIKFIPENWDKTYFHWMENIQDWCISRQLWWGHRIPAWYDEQGNIYVAQSEADARQQYQLKDSLKLTQDSDVLDTWFSSALWPFATMGWPEKTPELENFVPSSVLVTGFDIIFFWVARMIMMTLKFTGKVPFKEVYITGLIRDEKGQKMSKTKGNVLDPIDLIDGIELPALIEKRTQGLMNPKEAKSIEKNTRQQFANGIQAFGTDALRITFCALASTSRDINFDLGRVEGYRNYCNKLWNAARYVLMNTENKDCGKNNSQKNNSQKNNPQFELSIADRWIISRLQQAIANYSKHISEYRFDLATQTLYEFSRNDYCDWYLELSKPILYSDNYSEPQKIAARHTLVNVLETSMRLLHPMMPFISEEIWQRLKPMTTHQAESIMICKFPQADSKLIDEKALHDLQWIQTLSTCIRRIHGELNISPAKPIKVLLKNMQAKDKQCLNEYANYICSLDKLELIAQAEKNPPLSATGLADNMQVLVPLAGLIDLDAELQRLSKTINKYTQDIQRLNGKLNNAKFVNNAPAEVVEKEKEKLAAAQESLQKLTLQHDQLAQMQQ